MNNDQSQGWRERLEEQTRKRREVAVVISCDAEGYYYCRRPDLTFRTGDVLEFINAVSMTLAWRRGEPENSRYMTTAEKLVVELLDQGRKTSLEIPVDLDLVDDFDPTWIT